MLFAVAVVFIGLGWHSAATAGNDAPTTEAATTVSSSPTSTPASTSAASTDKRLCVINAGQVAGLASDVTDLLEARGYQMAEPGNYTAGVGVPPGGCRTGKIREHHEPLGPGRHACDYLI